MGRKLQETLPVGTKPDARNVLQRNRIISGLAHGTIVVEAGNKSGAMLTALNAVDRNREIFPFPGGYSINKAPVHCD